MGNLNCTLNTCGDGYSADKKGPVKKRETAPDRQLAEVSLQFDKAFEQFYFEMDEEEAKSHIMRLIYHMLGVINEIFCFRGKEEVRASTEEWVVCIAVKQKEIQCRFCII